MDKLSYKEVVEAETVEGIDVFKSLKEAYADKVKVKVETTVAETELTPLKDGEKGVQEKVGFWASFLKPKVTVLDPDGNVIYSKAPYGEPKDSAGVTKAGLLAGVLGVLGIAFGAGRASK